MYIKSYRTKQFAGIQNREIEFEKGLNVILGENESGKSTTIDGIYSTIFKDIKLKRNNTSDLEFVYKYMPKPSGDYINGEVVIDKDDIKYTLKKEWGSEPSIELDSSRTGIIKEESKIRDELNKLLIYGEATYNNIVFTKQKDLKNALNNIKENSEVSRQVTDVMRKAVMELDGISIQDIENNINSEIEILYKRWDINKQYPENNRGINNPYKTGLGKILESYYKKENTKYKMYEVDKYEKDYEKISILIKEISNELDLLKTEKNKLETMEDDIRKRLILDLEIKNLNKELEDLIEANKKWPLAENQLSETKNIIKEIALKNEELLNERKISVEYNLLKKNIDIIEKINTLEGMILNYENENSKLPDINDLDIKELENIEKNILRLETMLKSGTIMGRLAKGNTRDIRVIKDLNDEEQLIDKNFEANGYVNIKYKDELELEFKIIELDYLEIKKQYKEDIEKYQKQLLDLKIKSIDEAKLIKHKRFNNTNEIRNLQDRVNILLNGRLKEDILNDLAKIENMENIRAEEDILRDIEENNLKNIEFVSKEKLLENQVNSWKENYDSFDKLFDLIIERKMENKEKEEELLALAELPDEFETVDCFVKRLKILRLQIEEKERELSDKNIIYYDLRSNLSDVSFEELKKEYIDLEKEYSRLILKGDKLLKIKDVFLETKQNVFENPMSPLVDEFSKYISIITDNKYQTANIDEDFNIGIEYNDARIPIDLLSAGTHDSVALALRFSIFKHLFPKQGFFILDDCLVDLDPIRKQESIHLIKEFGKDYQVIFTTCDPETAKMLGGNLINL